jgi:hypothetical protein
MDDINKFFEIPFRKRLNEIDSSSSDKVVSAAMAGFNVVRYNRDLQLNIRNEVKNAAKTH